ncbi:group III truncated hemoglobin [Novosphingobium tardum]|uniref:Group III truncated hemoglobin n=1 Tax=Novosphingobium tardum TaxID=1538021 RepID=A0ABV8RR31_9SPHN
MIIASVDYMRKCELALLELLGKRQFDALPHWDVRPDGAALEAFAGAVFDECQTSQAHPNLCKTSQQHVVSRLRQDITASAGRPHWPCIPVEHDTGIVNTAFSLTGCAMTDALSETDIARVIPEFYSRVRADPFIGPLFNASIQDWPHHLDRLIAFWSSVMLTTGTYKGSPMAAHIKHRTEMEPKMFGRWLELWSEVTNEMLAPEAAAALQAKARNIAESLKLALWFRLDRKVEPA